MKNLNTGVHKFSAFKNIAKEQKKSSFPIFQIDLFYFRLISQDGILSKKIVSKLFLSFIDLLTACETSKVS